MKYKDLINKTRQDFLLSFFNEESYQEKEINGFWLIKMINSDSGKWQVSIFRGDSYKRYKSYKN